jgi:type VI protein secretion system component VasF
MNTPPTSANERRALPRHIRDGEHHHLEESTPAGRARWRQLAPWVLLAVALVGFAALWAWYGRT